jgi:DNA-directed RNA polymerase specialized sigma24 family protein
MISDRELLAAEDAIQTAHDVVQEAREARDALLVQASEEGRTYDELATILGVSRGRIDQICSPTVTALAKRGPGRRPGR